MGSTVRGNQSSGSRSQGRSDSGSRSTSGPSIRQLMTSSVATCQADEPCSTAVKLMWDNDCGAVPVLSRDGSLAGMITDRDICMATWSQDRSPSAIKVSSVMSTDLYVCTPEDSLQSAERLMQSKQIRRLPVIDDSHRLVGILSLADIARAAEESTLRGQGQESVAEELTATLANICEPRRPHH